MVYPLKMVIFYSYVKSPEGKGFEKLKKQKKHTDFGKPQFIEKRPSVQATRVHLERVNEWVDATWIIASQGGCDLLQVALLSLGFPYSGEFPASGGCFWDGTRWYRHFNILFFLILYEVLS